MSIFFLSHVINTRICSFLPHPFFFSPFTSLPKSENQLTLSLCPLSSLVTSGYTDSHKLPIRTEINRCVKYDFTLTFLGCIVGGQETLLTPHWSETSHHLEITFRQKVLYSVILVDSVITFGQCPPVSPNKV